MKEGTLMKLGTTYICVHDMQKALNFYKTLLQEEPVYANDDRWISFACGISLYNKQYDERLIKEAKKDCFNQAYLEDFLKEDKLGKNTIVVFNFEVDDLKLEYERLQASKIGPISNLIYVNVHLPYWYFNIYDPDGNTLEITGPYVA